MKKYKIRTSMFTQNGDLRIIIGNPDGDLEIISNGLVDGELSPLVKAAVDDIKIDKNNHLGRTEDVYYEVQVQKKDQKIGHTGNLKIDVKGSAHSNTSDDKFFFIYVLLHSLPLSESKKSIPKTDTVKYKRRTKVTYNSTVNIDG